MDVNALIQAEDAPDSYDADESRPPSDSGDLPLALLAKMEAMVQHRVAALLQGKEYPRGGGDRVPGLKASDIEKLRSEGRCFRCKQKGHSKRDCTKEPKPSFQ